jgi:hypothetical protein
MALIGFCSYEMPRLCCSFVLVCGQFLSSKNHLRNLMREFAVCIVHLVVLIELLNTAQIEVHNMLNTHLGNRIQFWLQNVAKKKDRYSFQAQIKFGYFIWSKVSLEKKFAQFCETRNVHWHCLGQFNLVHTFTYYLQKIYFHIVFPRGTTSQHMASSL